MLHSQPFLTQLQRHAAATPHSPRQNYLLAALPPEDYAYLLPYLELVPLRAGDTVYKANELTNYLYFVTAGVVCRFHRLENGAAAEFAVTGNEGVIGIAAFLSGESTSTDVEVVSAGYAYRLRTNLLHINSELNNALRGLLLRYTHTLITQVGQIAACNRHHSLKQRLCFLILSCLDRICSHELAMTQEQIADMLGVRREGVTQAVGHLRKAGLIHCDRGHIAVLNRLGLEEQVCECYVVLKQDYDHLLQSQRSTRNASMRRAPLQHGLVSSQFG